MKPTKTVLLTESAVMLAVATILSALPLVNLPYGGSITAMSMLPIVLIAYRRGLGQGLLTAFAFSLLQLLLGLNNLSYVATSPVAVIAVIVLDYLLAFTALGLGGVFRKRSSTQAKALVKGVLLVCGLRFLFHFIAGCTVWAGLSIPTSQATLYSLAYNATYMVPETLVTLVGAVYLSRFLDFGSETITRTAPQAKRPDWALLLSGLSKAFWALAAIVDISLVFPRLQNAETGDFDITGIQSVNWIAFLIVTAAGLLLGLLFAALSKRVPADDTRSLRGLFNAIPYIGFASAAVLDALMIAELTAKEAPDSKAVITVCLLSAALVAALVLVILHQRKKSRAA